MAQVERIQHRFDHGGAWLPLSTGAKGRLLPHCEVDGIGAGFLASQLLPESVHKLLVELAKQTGETLFLAAPEGTSVVFLDVVESSADIRFIANVGQRLPIHVTAAGRAILSQYLPAERAATLKRIKYQSYEKDTFMTPESVESDIQKSADAGWYVNLGIYAPGVAGIAVPFHFAVGAMRLHWAGRHLVLKKILTPLAGCCAKPLINFCKRTNEGQR